MIPELGHFSLILALGLSLALFVLPMLGVIRRDMLLMQTGPVVSTGLFVFVGISFASLIWAFVQDDFSVNYVARNSNISLPVQYKVSAVWGAHEGSFLLWTLIMTGWILAVALASRSLTTDMRARVLSILGFLASGFILFILFTSNPFERSLPVYPQNGADLNPLLQDFGLIVHPPMLYMGYVGFAVPFAMAVATLTTGQLDAAWARWSRPWTNVAWAFLTIGITLGSWWAYYELGWGGWWFWDAVENASFMPWLVGTALVHSFSATEKRGVFKSWTVLLAIFAFSLSLLGAFLVRSGVLTSVHAFAVDPERGMFILIFLVLVVGGSLLLFALKAGNIKSDSGFSLTSREALLLGNNALLVVATAAVLLGTLYPLIYEVFTDGRKLSVGPPYFNLVFVPLALALLAVMALAPESRWRRTPLPVLLRAQAGSLVLAVILVAVALVAVTGSLDFLQWFSNSIALWVVLNLLLHTFKRTANKVSLGARVSSLLRMSPAWYGMWVAHFGLAMSVMGITVTTGFSSERDLRMQPGDSVILSGYEFRMLKMEKVTGPNYLADQGVFEVYQEGEHVYTLMPEKRQYRQSGQVMTEADMEAGFFRDLYIALGDRIDETAWSVRIHYKPFVRWIWLGGLLIALGGFVSVMDRRYRILATRRKVAGSHLTAGLVNG